MTKYSEETKSAVMAALLAGQSLNQVAKEYNVPRSTLSRWKNSDVPLNGTQKKEIGDLLLDYLRANLETLTAQAEMFKNPEWLKKQTASDAAVLHGVMTDKAIRLLEAMSKE
jgi:transposase-like protein